MLRFETPPFRPPSEAHSLLIRATRNCSWNRCAFCYGIHWNRGKLEIRSVDDIKQDISAMQDLATEIIKWAKANGCLNQIQQVAASNGVLWLTNDGVKSAFIGDLDSLVMKTSDMVQVVEFLYETFPAIERVTCYARAKTILKRPQEDLKKLRTAGVSRLHLGLETGDDALLKFINKGATAHEMIKAGRMVKKAGISLSEYVILGLGGQAGWREHARQTAKVLNAIDPDFIRVRTLSVFSGTPLFDAVNRGEFSLLSDREILKEERLLISLLEVNSEFVSDHISNYVPVEGKLPMAKQEMLEQLDDVLSSERLFRS
jgi:radical SAM superfamily enzyme YgiQ (UPF0313 family)